MKKAFTLVELLVVISIIALLLAILMPSLEKARNQAKTLVCVANEHQIGLAMGTYAVENNNAIPPERWGVGGMYMWGDILVKINPALTKIVCPAYPYKNRKFFDPKYFSFSACGGGYGINDQLDGVYNWITDPRPVIKINSFKRPADTIFCLEGTAIVILPNPVPYYDCIWINYLAVVPNNVLPVTNFYDKHGDRWGYKGAQARADHGAKQLQTRNMQPNYVFSSLNEMDQIAKIDVIFLDQHAATLPYGAVRNEKGVTWGWKR